MHNDYTNLLLGLPEFRVSKIVPSEANDSILMEVIAIIKLPSCPYCGENAVIHNGVPYHRTVRHLPIFGKKVCLLIPAIRLCCTACDATFMHEYESVEPYKRFTKAFQQQTPRHVIGATVTHAAAILETSYSTVERIYKQWMEQETPRIQSQSIEQARHNERLVLGIDDFAIRKGHTYNTGLHDLRGEAFLDIIPGRTLKELLAYYENHSLLGLLNPVAVVMDLAQGYHSFIKQVYPDAIRIADRFHVNGYVTEALQNVRKDVQNSLSPRARKHLKEHHRILGKRNDDLSDKERVILNELLHYSDALREAYEWKEAFIEWYDNSSSYELAKVGFDRWLDQGKACTHSAVQTCLRTMNNWKEEICNYHQLRFTNAAVEGRNNKIKALQRRHYFTRNAQYYKQRILLECNKEYVCV